MHGDKSGRDSEVLKLTDCHRLEERPQQDVIFSLEHFVFRDTFPRPDNGGIGDSSESSAVP
jgi:hypothetical protein